MDEMPDIVSLRRRYESQKQQLDAAYAAFGAAVAAAERMHPLGACRKEWEAYDAALSQTSQAQRQWSHLSSHLGEVSDAQARIKQTEGILSSLQKELGTMQTKLGMAAWGDFQNMPTSSLGLKVAPYYANLLGEWNSCGTSPIGKLKRQRLERLVAKTAQKVGQLLLSGEDFRLVSDSALVAEAADLLERRSEAKEDLENDQRSVGLAGGQSDKVRLEEAKRSMDEQTRNLQALAQAYGQAVFDQIDPMQIKALVGENAFRQGLAIATLKGDVQTSAQAINRLEGEKRAQELEAQIGLEKERLALLEEKKKELDRQITEVLSTISSLKRKAFKYRGGVDG